MLSGFSLSSILPSLFMSVWERSFNFMEMLELHTMFFRADLIQVDNACWIYRHLYDNEHLIIDILFIYIWNSHQSLLAKGDIKDFENSHASYWPYTFACKINHLF